MNFGCDACSFKLYFYTKPRMLLTLLTKTHRHLKKKFRLEEYLSMVSFLETYHVKVVLKRFCIHDESFFISFKQ